MVDKKKILEWWANRPPFKDIWDIPSLPVVNEEDYRDIIIPNIIRCGGIPKSELVIGKCYRGSCRNADEAVWNGEEFEYTRVKWGYRYTETINHFEDDDGYDLFVPFELKG